MTFWKEETLEQQRKHLQATTRWQAQTTRMQPHFTNLAWWSFNQLAKPTQTHLLEFEGERVYESKPALPHQGLKNFLTRNNAYFQKTQGGACEAREFESHQQLPWWLHVHAPQQIPEGLACWLTSWFCRDLTFGNSWALVSCRQVIPDGCGFGPIWTGVVQKRAWLNWSRISEQEPGWSSVSRSYLGMGHPYTKSAWLPETDTRWAFNWRRPLQV